MPQDDHTAHYDGPSGGWGSLRGMARIYARELSPPAILKTLSEQNKPHGFACVSCAWAKPADHHLAEFCENGAKATMWEMTSRRCTPEFFAKHTVTELREWQRLRSRAAGPTDPSTALRPRDRPVRAVRLGRGLRGDRPGVERDSIPSR